MWSEPARDLIRELAKYSELGLERYWVVDPDGPEIIVFQRVDEWLAERSRHPSATVLDVGPATVQVDPSKLAD